MDERGIFFIFLAVTAAILLLVIWQAEKTRIAKNKQIKEVYTQYQNALKKKDKVQALALGRKYYALQRKNNRLTIYDEQAITNDLNSIS